MSEPRSILSMINMFHNKQKKILSHILIGFLACVGMTPCLATIDVMSEDTEGYYGNAEIRPFRDIIDNTDELTPCDKEFLEGVVVTRVTERTYFRAMVGKPTLRLSGVENKSSPPADVIAVASPSLSDKKYGLLLAAGHVWEHWAIEGEFYASKKLTLNANPLIPNFPNFITPALPFGPQSASANINLYALFLNLVYILPRWFDICPLKLQIHLDAGVGGSLKTANLTITDRFGFTTSTNSKQSWSVAGLLGAGLRYQMTPHFLVDFAYRYMNLGRVRYGPIQVGPPLLPEFQAPMKFQTNQVTVSGFFIGFTYQF